MNWPANSTDANENAAHWRKTWVLALDITRLLTTPCPPSRNLATWKERAGREPQFGYHIIHDWKNDEERSPADLYEDVKTALMNEACGLAQ
jgi:hypothetical protein